MDPRVSNSEPEPDAKLKLSPSVSGAILERVRQRGSWGVREMAEGNTFPGA